MVIISTYRNKEKIKMENLFQQLNDPTLCAQLQAFDPHKLVGLAGAPAIQQAIEYLKYQWGLSTKLAPLTAIVLGVALNAALAAWFGLSLTDAVALGAATGLLASGWHVVSKE